MKFLIGNEKVFTDFIGSITKKDRVAILSHDDLDGISSAVFIYKILEKKEIKPILVEFFEIKPGILGEVFKKLSENKITKIVIPDLCVDDFDNLDFEKLRKEYDILFIDHHPIVCSFENKRNIIKTSSEDCTSLVLFQIGSKLFDSKKWAWLACAAAFAEFSYNSPENFNFMKKFYPSLKLEKISQSDIAKMARIISYSIIHLESDTPKVFNLVLTKNLRELKKSFSVINLEIKHLVKDFQKNSEFFSSKDLYFYYANKKIKSSKLVSLATTILSIKEPDKMFVFVSDFDGEFIKANSRCQSGKYDVSSLMKKGVEGLENGIGGGHLRAAGARFLKKDIEQFKKNILSQ